MSENSTEIFDLHKIITISTSFLTVSNTNYLLIQTLTFFCWVFNIFFTIFNVLLRKSFHFSIYSELVTFQSAGIRHQNIWIANLRKKQYVLSLKYALIYPLEWFRSRIWYFVYHLVSNVRLSSLNSSYGLNQWITNYKDLK